MPSPIKILIAPDKFRPKLSAQNICRIISSQLNFKYKAKCIPMADGGQGSLQCISQVLNAEKKYVTVSDPLFRPIKTYYLFQKQKKIAYIEMAKASGLSLLRMQQRNPMKTSTFGTGELIKNAIVQGCKNIVLMIGGSATNEGGIGAANALGYRFLCKNNKQLIPNGENLQSIQRIVLPQSNALKQIKIEVATDVTSPLIGHRGATYLFGAQKGANKEQLQKLQRGMINLNRQFIKYFNKDAQKLPGGGAAGGLGAGSFIFFNATIVNGFNKISSIVNLAQCVEQSDIIVTGQGKVDSQTIDGKVVQGVINIAKNYNKPLVIFCGKSQLDQKALGQNIKIVSNQTQNMNDEYSIQNAQRLLRKNVNSYFK